MTGDRPILFVIDDDEDIREILSLILHDEGYTVLTAPNGARALEMLAEGIVPSLILLDLMMPVMDGWAFWDHRELTPALRKIPVVVLSASGLRTGSLGDAVILPKPVERDVLLKTIADAVSAS